LTEVYFTNLPDIANILEALIGYFKIKRKIDLDEALDRIKKTKKAAELLSKGIPYYRRRRPSD
jgi:hypothetical protein